MPLSVVPIESLKSPIDPNLPFYSFKQKIGTAPIIIDIYNQFGCLAKAIIITNDDSTNTISAVNVDPNNPVEIIPASSKGEDDSWTTFISVTPNAVSGAGLLEIQLVKIEDARKPMQNNTQNQIMAKGMML